MSRKIRKFWTNKFDTRNKRKFWLVRRLPAVYWVAWLKTSVCFSYIEFIRSKFSNFLLMYSGSLTLLLVRSQLRGTAKAEAFPPSAVWCATDYTCGFSFPLYWFWGRKWNWRMWQRKCTRCVSTSQSGYDSNAEKWKAFCASNTRFLCSLLHWLPTFERYICWHWKQNRSKPILFTVWYWDVR